jgi:hypothetical protein
LVLEDNTYYGVSNTLNPMMSLYNEEYKIVNYGDVSDLAPANIFRQGTSIVSSLFSPFEFIDLGNMFYPITSRTTSEINIVLPGTTWFLNDKANKSILFPSFQWYPWEITEACSPEITNIGTIEQFIQASKKIGAFANYSENWDSYGAKTINKDCIIMGIKIIKQLIDLKSSISFEIPTPFVAPLSSGGIQMEWEQGDRYLEISISPNHSVVEYFAIDRAKGGQLSLEGSLKSLSFLKELISWFVNGTAEDLSYISPEESYEEWAF